MATPLTIIKFPDQQFIDLSGFPLTPVRESPAASTLGDSDLPQERIVESNPIDPSYRVLDVPWLVGAFNLYRDNCTCGNRYDNNCAHFLSNAFLLQAPNYRFPNQLAKCPHGRLIRAKEMLDWFRTISTGYRQNCNGITEGIWFTYQESGGQGHVVLHNHAGGLTWRGTGNYPGWPVQWHYFY
jgi:hypothetical protein